MSTNAQKINLEENSIKSTANSWRQAKENSKCGNHKPKPFAYRKRTCKPTRSQRKAEGSRVDCPPLRPPELAGAKVGKISARGPEIKQVGALVGKKVQKLAWASILPGKGLTSRRARQKRCRARYLLSFCTRPSIRAWRSGKALAQSERSRVRFLAPSA